jgi:SulP family sulfate permease
MTRWAAILASAAMLLIVLVIPGLVEQVPMAALGALMIMAGLGAINYREARSIWNTGWNSRLPIVVTFVATLFLSIPVAVLIGIVITVILYLMSSSDVSLKELVAHDDGTVTEHDPPARLPDEAVTVLGVYGSLFFAGASVLARKLPSAHGARHPVVVLRLRGRTSVGATLVAVLAKYAGDIHDAGGRLYLSGVSPEFNETLTNTGKLDLSGPVTAVPATAVVGASSRTALDLANAWLLRQAGDDASGATT